MNLRRSEIVFLESTVHRLSVNALLVYQTIVHEDTKQVIPSIPYSCNTRQSMKIKSRLFHVDNRKKLILCGFKPDVLSNFRTSAAETRIFNGLKIVFLESTDP